MKKLLIFSAIIIISLVLIQIFQLAPLGILGSDGYALSDNTIGKILKSEDYSAKKIEPVEVKASDEVYKRLDSYYVGSNKVNIDADYPVFINDSSALLFLNNDAKLVTSDFDKLGTYNGLYLSNGISYNPDKQRADNEEFILTKLSNGLYINASDMAVTTNFGDKKVVMNSILYFSSNTIRYFSLENGLYVQNTINGLNRFSKITFGDITYDYFGFLQRIGEMQSETATPPKDVKSNIETTTTTQPEVTTAPSETTTVTKAETTTASPVTTPETTPTEPETTPSTTQAGIGEPISPSSPNPFKYYKVPQVSVDNFTSDVYSVSSHISISDSQSRIKNGVRFELYLDGKVFMRKGMYNSGDILINQLKPGSTYKIIGKYTYIDFFGVEQEVNFFEQTISTLIIDTLKPVTINFKNGQLYSDKIALSDISLTSDANSAKTIQYIEKAEVVFNGESQCVFSSKLLNDIKSGSVVSYLSQPIFKSNTDYKYTVYIYDRFGNKLPLEGQTKGTTKTCKQPPTATVKLEKNEIGNTQLKFTVINPDNVKIKSCYIVLLNKNGEEITTSASVDGSQYINSINHSISSDKPATISFSNLSTSSAYSAVVYADYDIEDGQYLEGNKSQIFKTTFATKSLSSLGNIYFTNSIKNLTSNSCDFEMSINNEKTDDLLAFLMSEVTVTIKSADNKIVLDKTLSSDEINQLKASNTLSIPLSNLSSCMKYNVVIKSKATQAEDVSPIRTVYPVTDFKTLKATPVVSVRDSFVTSSTIDLFNFKVIDPDKAISGKITMKLTDSTGIVRGIQSFDTNTLYSRVTFKDGLVKNEKYTISFTATEYNTGYTNATFEALHELSNIDIVTKEGLSGSIKLQGLNKITGNDSQYNARLKVTVNDVRNELNSNPKYFVNVYKNNNLIATVEQKYNGGQSQVDTLNYSCDKNSSYRFELYVQIYEYVVTLSKSDFTTEQEIFGFSTQDEMRNMINANLTGKFIALNDIVWTYSSYTQSISYDTAKGIANDFNGSVDYQGYTLTNNSGNEVFYNIGKIGSVKNVVLNFSFGASDGRAGLVYNNYGDINNVIVNFGGAIPSTNRTNSSIGFICGNNMATGVIENFSVNLKVDAIVNANIGVVYYNQGLIRNGNLYSLGGQSIVSAANTLSNYRVGGIAGLNYTKGKIQNVYSIVDILTLDTPATTQQGCISGESYGVVKNSFSVGDVYRDSAKTYAYATNGPAIGVSTGSGMSSAYYVSKLSYANTANSAISKMTLYDKEWYKCVINKDDDEFNVDDLVSLGFYPQVKLSDVMPQQDYIPLPEITDRDKVDLLSAVVTEQTDSYALATFSFNNPAGLKIKSVSLEYADAQIVDKTQVQDKDISRVQVKITNPSKFLSKYNVTQFDYYTYASNSNAKQYALGDRDVKAEFYKSISTPDDWFSMDYTQNYRLANDIDFKNVAAQRIYKSSQFLGKLDGADHTISNIDVAANGCVFKDVRGGIYNLRINNLNMDSPKCTVTSYNGFIGYLKGTVDNVHLSKVYINTSLTAGALIGKTDYSTITNSSVTDLNADSYSYSYRTVTIGGLIGNAYVCTVSNCFGQNVDIDVTNVEDSSGVGGLIAYADQLTLSNAYVTGKVNSQFLFTGGVIGRYLNPTNADFINVWSNVQISTITESTGGLIGRCDGGEIRNALSIGSIITTLIDPEGINAGVGMGTSGVKLTNIGVADSYTINNSPVTASDVKLLTDAQLKSQDTYTKTLGMDNNFDYSQLVDGILPKLYYAGTTDLLPNQLDNKLPVNDIYITSVTTANEGSNKIVQVEINHGQGVKITDAVFDYLTVDSKVVSEEPTRTILKYKLTDNPVRYLDTYRVVQIKYTLPDSTTENKMNVQYSVRFGDAYYLEIRTVDEWKEAMRVHGMNFENFRIINNLDFTGQSNLLTELKINRLVGPQTGEKVTLKNITLGNAARSLIAMINSKMDRVCFDKFTLNTTSTTQRSGIISNSLGDITNCNFTNINITTKTGYYVGCIAYSQGKVSDCILDTATINATAATDVGGLVGSSTTVGKYNSLSAKNVTINGKGRVGGIIGESSGSYDNSMFDLNADTITITATDQYSGGLIGIHNDYSLLGKVTNFQQSGSTITILEVSKGFIGNNIRITGTSNVGGLFGYARYLRPYRFFDNNYNSISNSIIIGTGDNVGGIGGNAEIMNSVVSNCKIFGSSNIGGVVGNGSVQYSYVQDSTISTKYDSKFATYGTVVMVGDSTTQNRNIGGLAGNWSRGVGTIASSGVVNSVVGAENSECVGGAVGSVTTGVANTYVLDTQVYGKNIIGGIAGNFPYSDLRTSYCNATVNATGSAGGGLIGEAVTDIRNTFRIYNSYYVGSITANDYAGGFVGRSLYFGTTSNNSVMIVGASVTSNGTHANLVANITDDSSPIGRINKLMIYDGSYVNGKAMSALYPTITNRTNTFNAANSYTRLVSTADLKTVANYTSWGLGASFNFQYVANGFMPYSIYGNNLLGLQSYQFGKTSDTYNSINPPFSYGVSTPTFSTAAPLAMARMTMMRMSPVNAVLPKLEVYTVDADKINLEFDSTDEAAQVVITSGEKELYSGWAENKVYTFKYDFASTINISVSLGSKTENYTITPDSLKKTVSVYGDHYYYITDNGVQSDVGVLAGSFINISNGKALTSTGGIYDLSKGEKISENTEIISLCENTQPLFYSDFNGSKIRTYKNFSEIESPDGTVSRPIRIIIKNNQMFIIDPTMQINTYGCIAEGYLDKQYLVALGIDGSLVNLMEQIVTPSDFENSNIKEISDNINTNQHVMVVKYYNGKIDIFDYLTGERLGGERIFSNISLLDYAKDFVNSKISSMQKEASDGYIQIKELKEQLTINPIMDTFESDTSSGSIGSGGAPQSQASAPNANQSAGIIIVYDQKLGSYKLVQMADIISIKDKEIVSVEEKIKKADPSFDIEMITKANKAIDFNQLTIGVISLICIAGAVSLLLVFLSRRRRQNQNNPK